MSSSAKRICLESSRQLRSQVTKIEKLCDDVLVEIFSYLSAEELKSATLVCKHWNEVIGSSTVTMKKFKLKLKESELSGRQFRSTRNYQNIELKMLATGDKPQSDQKSLENLDRFFELSQVKYFKIFAYNPAADPENAFSDDLPSDNPWFTFSIDAMKLTAALKQMKLLQELFIECPAGFRGSFTSTIDLPKLTKLAVTSPDASILQWISASNVTEIDLGHQSFGVSNVQHVASFLKLCKQITTLKLDSGLVHDLFGNGKWKDFNLKLSDLHIDIKLNPDAASLREFLMSQAPSLTSLRIKGFSFCLPGSNPVTEAIGQLKNLKILSLDYLFGPNVTFLKHLTELEQLTVHAADGINSIARFNRKLTYLKIEFVKSSLDAALEFSELKHLCIGYDPSSYYLKVIRGCPKLETVELGLPKLKVEDYDDTIGIVLQHPTLRHLKLVYRGIDLHIEQLEEAFDRITGDYGHLKSLSLSLSMRVGDLVWRSVKFLLPENRSDWNVDEQKMRLMETFSFKGKFRCYSTNLSWWGGPDNDFD